MMKKIGIVIGLLLLFVVAGILLTLKRGETTISVKQSWALSSKSIKTLEFYGSKQAIDVKVVKSESDETSVQIEGKVSEESVNNITKNVKMSSDSLYIPFSQHGFNLALSSQGKDKLYVTISLGKNATFEKIFVDTLVGDVSITVPEDFDGIYTLYTNNTGEVLRVPTTNQTSNSVIEVDGYSKISVEKGENNG